MALYKGFSSFEFAQKKKFRLTDVELVKMDLLNHIFTKRGSRVMMPTFGTDIPNLVFEPLDEEVVELVREQLQQVINFDPRVEGLELNVQPNFGTGEIIASARLLYVELNTVDSFELNITFEG